MDVGDFTKYAPVVFFERVAGTWSDWHTQAVEVWGNELTDEIENSDGYVAWRMHELVLTLLATDAPGTREEYLGQVLRDAGRHG